MKERAPVISKIYVGNQTFAQTNRRNYFYLYANDDLDIVFGGGDGCLPIYATGHFEPLVIPTTEFTVFTNGAFVFISDAHETV
jgi:hypothetical protein